jgi:hypothetical protein
MHHEMLFETDPFEHRISLVHFYSCIFNARTVQSHSTETVVLRCTLIAQVCGKSLAMIPMPVNL